MTVAHDVVDRRPPSLLHLLIVGLVGAWCGVLGLLLVELATNPFWLGPENAKPYVIRNSPGGIIIRFVAKYSAMSRARRKVVIDGECYSACTMVLRMPRDLVCMTPRAKLGFHSAWIGEPDNPRHSAEGTAYMWRSYPEAVKRLLRSRGWNGRDEHLDFIMLSSKDLASVIRRC